MVDDIAVKDPCNLILFGALGDLATRKLLPALYQLDCSNLLHPNTTIICCAREPLDTTAYLLRVKKKVKLFLSETFNEQYWERICNKIVYCVVDLAKDETYFKLKNSILCSTHVSIFYFAIPPSLYAQTCKGLSNIHLIAPTSRVVLEKPIGHDLPSSIEINNTVAEYFSENQIYRIDHYLGKETVLNLLVLRFANAIFSSNWDHNVIEKIEITVAEKVGVEGRWSYYDQSGQVRDMLQNHLLQILSLVAMEPPISLAAESLRSEKLKILKSLRPINRYLVKQHTVRAQYSSGSIHHPSIPGYLEEVGALNDSKTETFVAVKAFIDNWRWSGVPFYLITGKRLSKKQSEVAIYFKAQPHNIFKDSKEALAPNQLIIRLQPDEGVEVRMMNKVPGLSEKMELSASKLDLNFNSQRIADAYERLLLEVMLGNQYLFISREEVEQAWSWIDDILQAWDKEKVPLYTYPAGSSGPEQVALLYPVAEEV